MNSHSVRRRVASPALFAFLSVIGIAGEMETAPPDLLDQIRARMSDNLTRLPNCTCVETIERMQRDDSSGTPEMLDRMRLEVGMVDGRELFSWPGQDSFDDRSIEQIVPGGAIGTGSFGLHAKVVFQSGHPTFQYAGAQDLEHRHVLRWDFVIGRHSGGMRLGRRDKSAMVGTHGSFWADPQTLNVVRLDVEADNIPRELELASVSDSVFYTPVKIGQGVFLLPQTAELRMRNPHQFENINRVRFTGCREYVGESRMIEGDVPEPKVSAAVPSQMISLPPGATLDLVLDTPVRFETSAIGDPLTFRLRRPLRHHGQVLFDKGAVVHGRLTLLQREDTATVLPGFTVGIRLFEIEAPGKRAVLDATLSQTAQPGYKTELFERPLYRAKALVRTVGSVFFQPGTSEVLKRNTALVWRTVAIGN